MAGPEPFGDICGFLPLNCAWYSGVDVTSYCCSSSWDSRSCIGVGLKIAAPDPGGGGSDAGPQAFFNQLAGNGVFLTLIALQALLILVLPLVVAVVAGDSIAGEAGYGTLRYLLTRPAGRTRLLSVKYLAIVTYGLVATLIIGVVALLVGVILFPSGR